MRQFVIQLANRPGELAHLARALAARGIDLRHVACLGSGSEACAFIIPSDEAAMRQVLRGFGHRYIEGEAVVTRVPDQPGGLAEVAERLARAGVNILGTISIGRGSGYVEMAFTVDDEEKARRVLGANQELHAVAGLT